MADTKITGLTENTAPISTDIIPMVDDPGGTPVTQKVTLSNLRKGIVAGSDTQVQFNDGGTLNGDAGLVYNKTTDTLTIGAALNIGTVSVSGGSIAVNGEDAFFGVGVDGVGTYIDVGSLGDTNNVWIDARSANTTNVGVKIRAAGNAVVDIPSAGGLTLAGVAVPTISSTSTLTNKTLTSPVLTTPSAFTTGGTITLAENTSIALDPAGSADGKYTGITITGTSGYAQAFGDLVYLDPTDSRWEAVDANSAAGADGDARGMLAMVVSAGTDGNACTLLLQGVIRADAKFPSFTINNPIYASETAGSVTQTRPTTTDVVIRVVGFALTADEMYFNPSPTYITPV